MRSWIVCLMLCAAPIWGARAQTPVEIVDGRVYPAMDDLSPWLEQPALQQAGAAARAHWRAQDASYEEEFHVLSVAEGAFTQPGVAQKAVLYLMSLWPRCCPKMGIAIVEDERLVHNVAFEGIAQRLAAVPDLDDDGLDELVYTGSFGMGGQETGSITLVAFTPDGLAERGGATIYDSSCATGMEGSTSTAAHILALPGPAFTIEWFKASCEDTAWISAGAPEPLTLDAPPGLTYVDLSGQ